MYDAGNQKSVFCENLEGWDGEGGGREVQEGGDMCVYIYTPMVNSCGCMAETSQYCKVIILKLKF